MITFTIPLKAKSPACPKGYRLPGLNEYTKANRIHRQVGAKLKADTEAYISAWIPLSIRGWELTGVRIRIDWYEFDRRRDNDNVVSAQKYILDALVNAHVLAGDGRRHIPQPPEHKVYVDKENPRVVVHIEKLEAET